MPSSVFMVGVDNALTELTSTDYESEDLLQKLLADHPALLGLAANGAPLLLVRREYGVPDAQGGGGRWSLDHLYLDPNGVPVLVEVKRATDTRARREVVAQMLDYAANGLAYWPIEQLIAAYQDTAGDEAESRLDAFLNDIDPETFWRQVEANLRSGRVKLVFVADRIAPELRRIVEFLNEQMRPAEVLAIEVEQFANASGLRTLVPRLVGDTERAQASKAISTSKPPITHDAWYDGFAERWGAEAGQAAREWGKWFLDHNFSPRLTASQDSLVFDLLDSDGQRRTPFDIRQANGRLETSLANLATCKAFLDDTSRQRLLDELRQLSGLVATDKLTGWPGLSVLALAAPEPKEWFIRIAQRIKRALESQTPYHELD